MTKKINGISNLFKLIVGNDSAYFSRCLHGLQYTYISYLIVELELKQ